MGVHRGESRNELRGFKVGGLLAMRGAVPCLSADLTTHAVKKLYTLQALKTVRRALRRARRDGLSAAVMSEVSGDAVRGFLACLFPRLVVAMTATCAILRRFDSTQVSGFS